MENNHEKIQAYIKKYNRTYWLYFLSYIVVLILAVIHILKKCVDVVESDYLKNKQKFDDLKGG